MGIIKKYLKNKTLCKVSFNLPIDAAASAKEANIVGEFNDWDATATPMEKLKDGSFTATLELETGREYQFRYLINKSIWETDSTADKLVPTPFPDSQNGVVVV